jgi:hypothetical protein
VHAVVQRGRVGCDRLTECPCPGNAVLLLHRQPLSHFMRPNVLTSQLTSSSLRPSTAQLFLPPKSRDNDARLSSCAGASVSQRCYVGREREEIGFRVENFGGARHFSKPSLAEFCTPRLPPFGLGSTPTSSFFPFAASSGQIPFSPF